MQHKPELDRYKTHVTCVSLGTTKHKTASHVLSKDIVYQL